MPGLDTEDSLRLIIDRIAAGVAAEADLAALRRALFVSGQENVVQIGKYTVRINEGQDIRIGDTIYQGPTAEAIQAAIRDATSARRGAP